jgi:hypothetical protein
MADYLASLVDRPNLRHAERAYDDNLTIVIAPVGSRATRQAGIGSLHK